MPDDTVPVESYTPIAEKLIDSSLWLQADHATLRVWLVMIVEAWKPRSKGQVRISLAGLAHKAVVSIQDARAAIDFLMAPDPNSRNHKNEGRRIEPLDPEHPYAEGWKLLNWGEFYEEFKRANHAYACKVSREKKRDQEILSDTLRDEPRPSEKNRDPVSEPVPVPIPEPGKKREGRRFAPPTLAEVESYVQEKGYHFSPRAFMAYYDEREWKRNDGKKLRDWHLACVTWEEREPSSRTETHRSGTADGPSPSHPPMYTGIPSPPPGTDADRERLRKEMEEFEKSLPPGERRINK